jgi:hypothetical protein
LKKVPPWSGSAPSCSGRAETLFFLFALLAGCFKGFCVTVDTFQQEISDALRAFDKFIVCLEKSPEECEATLRSLMAKAIKAYENRGPHLRHGIALDPQITIILSQTDHERPLCGIYFNLHSPYQKKPAAKARARKDAKSSEP